MAAAAGGPAQQQQPNPQPQQSGWQIFQSTITRMLIFYLAMQAMNYFKAKPPMNAKQSPGSPISSMSEFSQQPGNLFPKGTKFVNKYFYLARTVYLKWSNFSIQFDFQGHECLHQRRGHFEEPE